MIEEDCFSREHIDHQCRRIGANDRQLLEKSIHALALLGHLVESGLEFVFKGGSSLMLLLSPLRRLSTDIDIVCGAFRADLDRILAGIAQKSPFTRYVEQERGFRGLPNRRHFQFFFPSVTAAGREASVLLDVVEEAKPKLPTVSRPIRTAFIEVEYEVPVTMPSVEALLGDKLTAFAPRTIGIPYRSKSGYYQQMQVVKQMFDIGELFDAAGDLREVDEAFRSSYRLENIYRGSKFSLEQVLDDTLRVSVLMNSWGMRGAVDSPETKLLVQGIRRLQNHLVGSKFRVNIEAKTSAAKAAFLARLIRSRATGIAIEDIRYDSERSEDFRKIRLAGELAVLNRLWKTNPEAFYYWYKVNGLT